jgi:CDGSH-type Zn-finger protein
MAGQSQALFKSGAVLSFGGMTTTITPKVNGPLIVEGPARITAPDGTEIPVPPRKDGTPAQVIVLCRCGGSATKPFCDGSHKRNGFDSSTGPSPAPRP